MRLIIVSRILSKSKSAEQNNAHPDALQITREIESVLSLLFGLFKSKERADLGAQVMALKLSGCLFGVLREI